MASILKALKPSHLKHPVREIALKKLKNNQLKCCWNNLKSYTAQKRYL